MFHNAISISLIGVLLSCQNKPDSTENTSGGSEESVSSPDALTEELHRIYKQGYINGFSVAIVNQDQTIYQQGIGFSDLATKREYSEHTIQNVASISKTLIGIALLKAHELGKLNLDDPINKHLSFEVTNPHNPDAAISIRHLATHTSTIVDTEYYGDKAYVLKDEIDKSREVEKLHVKLNPPETHMPMMDMLKQVLSPEGVWHKKEGFLKDKPGATFRYSNIGATLAAVVLEAATGESFDGFTTEHILEPLNMASSGWSFRDVDLSMHTTLYANPDTEIPFYTLITYPDGGLITSANDLSKYLRELIKGYSGEGTLLSKESYEELFTKQLKAEIFSDEDIEVGANEGIFMSFEPSGHIGHSGSDPGVSTYMFFNPITKVGRILMVNTDFDSRGQKQYDALLNKLSEYEVLLLPNR